jgi:hypothetical protein
MSGVGAKETMPMTARKVGEHVELDKEEARSGQTGLHVRYILAFSTVLVLIGLGIVVLAS